jgi:hypothetical protein
MLPGKRVDVRAAHLGAHAREHLLGRERARDEIVRARLEALHRIGGIAAAGQHDHRDMRRRRVPANAAERGVAVHHRQHHVEQHDVGQVLVEQGERARPVGGR